MRYELRYNIPFDVANLARRRGEVVQILTVWGLGGAGKLQLVLHYIQEYRKDYEAVVLTQAGSKEMIERDYIQIYGLLCGQSASPEMATLEDVMPAVKRWF